MWPEESYLALPLDDLPVLVIDELETLGQKADAGNHRALLVKGDARRVIAKGTTYRQGYLNSAKERTVRIRVADAKASITIKGPTVGATRSEYEYEIPFGEGNAMVDTLVEKPLIERH